MTVRALLFYVIFPVCCLLIFSPDANAGNTGFGIHSGYGTVKYNEKSPDIEAESSQDVFLFGVSVEYSFPGHENYFANITTDWTVGLEGRETWRENGAEFQTNDMKISGQFYDLRLGYKDSPGDFYYRFYVSGGWDGMHFRRDKSVWRGFLITKDNSEDISLWRAGAGTGFGYKRGDWALDARLAYSYYPIARADNSSLSRYTFDTEGTCLDMGIGIARNVAKNINFYAGFSYTLIRLQKSDIRKGGSIQAVFPESKMEIMAGVINLTYSF